MVIREGDDWVDIEAVDYVQKDVPRGGDVELSVEVSSSRFTGRGFAWVDGRELATFIGSLEQLEQRRHGEAELGGLSPGDFRLRIWSVNRRGHIAIGGRITAHVRGETFPFQHSVEFGFEFDPTQLPAVLQGFRAIAENRSANLMEGE